MRRDSEEVMLEENKKRCMKLNIEKTEQEKEECKCVYNNDKKGTPQDENACYKDRILLRHSV